MEFLSQRVSICMYWLRNFVRWTQCWIQHHNYATCQFSSVSPDFLHVTVGQIVKNAMLRVRLLQRGRPVTSTPLLFISVTECSVAKGSCLKFRPSSRSTLICQLKNHLYEIYMSHKCNSFQFLLRHQMNGKRWGHASPHSAVTVHDVRHVRVLYTRVEDMHATFSANSTGQSTAK